MPSSDVVRLMAMFELALLKEIHHYSAGHRHMIERATTCGCFYCEAIFDAKEVIVVRRSAGRSVADGRNDRALSTLRHRFSSARQYPRSSVEPRTAPGDARALVLECGLTSGRRQTRVRQRCPRMRRSRCRPLWHNRISSRSVTRGFLTCSGSLVDARGQMRKRLIAG